MNKILLCLDYNETIDNLQSACYDAECKGRIPTFFMGLRTLAAKTKSDIEIAFVSGAQVDDIMDEITVLNNYARQFAGVLAKDNLLFRYIVGGKNQELFFYEDNSRVQLSSEMLTKKEGVEGLLANIDVSEINLIVMGGDDEEDLAMREADTDGIPSIFIAPKNNKSIEEDLSEGIIKDSRNKEQEGIGRCLMYVANHLEELHLSSFFSQSAVQDIGQGDD